MTENQEQLNNYIISNKGLAGAFNSLCEFIDSETLDKWHQQVIYDEFVEQQKPLDGDIQKYVDEHFWEMIAEVDNLPKNLYDPKANYKGEVKTKQQYKEWLMSLAYAWWAPDAEDVQWILHNDNTIWYWPCGPDGYIDEQFSKDEWIEMHQEFYEKHGINFEMLKKESEKDINS